HAAALAAHQTLAPPIDEHPPAESNEYQNWSQPDRKPLPAPGRTARLQMPDRTHLALRTQDHRLRAPTRYLQNTRWPGPRTTHRLPGATEWRQGCRWNRLQLLSGCGRPCALPGQTLQHASHTAGVLLHPN